jgi:hypothetical protein
LAVETSISGSMKVRRVGPTTIASSLRGLEVSRLRSRPPRHRPGDPIIKGPVPHAWIASACRLPRTGLRVVMAYRFLCCGFRREKRWGLHAIARGLRISARSTRRGFHAAELAGLLAVDREPGCMLVVSVLGLTELEAGPKHRPLYGSIPWSWWLPASRLPGRSLQVASVCWLLAGCSRSADFELALDDWAEFGRSRVRVHLHVSGWSPWFDVRAVPRSSRS